MANQNDSDRYEVEQVFGLTGGELADDVWVAKGDDGREWTFHYWYEFAPEYAEKDLGEQFNYRTVVRDNMFGAPPETLDDGRWVKVATFSSSGEVEHPEIPGEFIYIGDGWAEVVYREREHTADEWREEGRQAGEAAGSWVEIKDRQTALRILDGYEDGDPEIMDMQPAPLSGEWAGASMVEILGADADDEQAQEAYEQGFADGFWAEVCRAARYQLED